jgi:hypothetical protein
MRETEHGATASGGAATSIQRGAWGKMDVMDREVCTTIARAFFYAATKRRENEEDILPQEDGQTEKLSVYCLFSELFPECACNTDSAPKAGLTRLQVQTYEFALDVCAWALTVMALNIILHRGAWTMVTLAHRKRIHHHAEKMFHAKYTCPI